MRPAWTCDECGYVGAGTAAGYIAHRDATGHRLVSVRLVREDGRTAVIARLPRRPREVER